MTLVNKLECDWCSNEICADFDHSEIKWVCSIECCVDEGLQHLCKRCTEGLGTLMASPPKWANFAA